MKINNFCFYLAALILFIPFYASAYINSMSNDSAEVIKLNKQAYNDRLTDPSQTIKEANKALNLANKLNFKAGIAEAYRVLGIGYYNSNQPEKAIGYYLTALKYFEASYDQ